MKSKANKIATIDGLDDLLQQEVGWPYKHHGPQKKIAPAIRLMTITYTFITQHA